ncbi:acyl-CoA carboxylase epsilon subunit [Knoellia sp. CPCC 206435]|uniref:acyl-CoA carboxylase epsilon subunit n=1 Tax=Knoellia terrae TaxID=3404797 RepID=UPI003B43883E
MTSSEAQRIEVIGDATPEQVAALVAVLSAASGDPVEAAVPRRTSAWSAPARAMRRPLTPAPGAWQHSLRP